MREGKKKQCMSAYAGRHGVKMRRKSVMDDCFSGQLPGNAISRLGASDVSEAPGDTPQLLTVGLGDGRAGAVYVQ